MAGGRSQCSPARCATWGRQGSFFDRMRWFSQKKNIYTFAPLWCCVLRLCARKTLYPFAPVPGCQTTLMPLHPGGPSPHTACSRAPSPLGHPSPLGMHVPVCPCAPAPFCPCTPVPPSAFHLAPLHPCWPIPVWAGAPAPLYPCTLAPFAPTTLGWRGPPWPVEKRVVQQRNARGCALPLEGHRCPCALVGPYLFGLKPRHFYTPAPLHHNPLAPPMLGALS